MKIFVIDNNTNFAELLSQHFNRLENINCYAFPFINNPTTLSLVEVIVKPALAGDKENFSEEKSIESDSILFINLNLKIDMGFRQDHKGIELLTWLRIKQIMNHCVLYSYQGIETIARANEKNRLLFSKGTTFVQAPTDFSDFNEEKIKYLSNNKANEEDIKKNIKPLFNVGEFRHREANWWGVKQLWDVHRIYKEGDFVEEYPEKVNENLSSLNNAIGSYLHELKIVSLSKEVERIAKSIEEIKNREETEILPLKNELNAKAEENESWKKEFDSLKQQYIEKLEWMMRNARYLGGNRNLYESVKEEAGSLERDKKEVEKLITDIAIALNSTSLDINNVIDKYRQIAKAEYSSLKKLLPLDFEAQRLINSKILIIDDEVNNGWEQIFREMMPKAYFKGFEPEKSYVGKVEDLYNEKVKDEISTFNPDLILLDLRLFEENDRSIETDKLSGKILLEFIKEDYKSVPILITTASNKIWTYQSLINIGADAYWIKEGIDEQRDVKDSIQNYCRLIFLINRLTDEKYKILKKLTDFTEQFNNFSSPSNYWAKIGKWSNGDPRNADIDGILKNLNECILIFRKYLHNFHLLENNQNKANEAFFVSGLINKIACIYENIHKLTRKERKQIQFFVEVVRKDTNSEDLRKLRNDVSHYDYEKKATWENLENAIELAEGYLRTPQ